MKKLFGFVLAFCFVLAATAVFAQDIQTRGSIGGTVTDENGAVVPGAMVKVTGDLGERTVTSNGQGIYSVENLAPGSYKVRVESANFKAAEVSSVTVYVGQTSTQNISLEAGAISETVTVTSGAGVDQASTAVRLKPQRPALF